MIFPLAQLSCSWMMGMAIEGLVPRWEARETEGELFSESVPGLQFPGHR